MEDAFYKGRLTDQHGLDVLVPALSDWEIVHNVIYDELCLGKIRQESRIAYREIIRGLAESGAQGIVLGCTEIGLLVASDDSPVPVFETTQIHAEAAVAYALARRATSAKDAKQKWMQLISTR